MDQDRFNESWPDATVPVHEFEPENVPVIETPASCASPVTSAVQVSYGASNPPAGMAMEKRKDVPLIEPEMEPRPVTWVVESVSDRLPENEPPDC
jgi:hypothetical protein